jgi:type I restriction enzyme R subunit
VNQYTVQDVRQPRRPDIVAFINGLPIAVIELKNQASEQADIWMAFNQPETYNVQFLREKINSILRGDCKQK